MGMSSRDLLTEWMVARNFSDAAAWVASCDDDEVQQMLEEFGLVCEAGQ